MADPEILFREALALHKAGRLDEAEATYKQVWEVRRSVSVLTNLGALKRAQGKPEQAAGILSQAAEAKPDDPEIAYNLGLAFADLARWSDAERAYVRAIELNPNHRRAQLNLSHVLLWQGRYEEGWPLYEVRRSVPGQGVVLPDTLMPEWKGEDVSGKSLLVWREQGLGDEIQFARFIPQLRELGARVTLACSEPLAPLLSELADVVPVTESLGSFDAWTLLLSLPGRLGVTLANLPSAPYLTAPQRPAKPTARIGLVWHGNPNQPKDAIRSLTPEARDELLRLPAMSLHPEDTGARDMADTAALIERLDLVITVCTSVAHLAGAMGKPVWVMLPYVGPDWRWLHGRTDSPWYSSARLYRQDSLGDWSGVIERVKADVSAL